MFHKLHKHREKLAYALIAVAVLLFLRAIFRAHAMPLAEVLLDASVASSLLARNVPRVIDLPMQYAYPVRCIERFTFCVAIVCFIALLLRRLWA